MYAQEISNLKTTSHLDPIPQNLNQGILIFRHLPEGGAASDGAHHGEDALADIDRLTDGGGSADGRDQIGDLISADGGEGADASRAEELHDADLAHLAPVVAVGAEGDVAVVVPEDLDADGVGAVGVAGVVLLEHFAGEVAGGDDDGVDFAELEAHEGAVLLGEVGDGAEGEGGEEVHVADDGEGFGARVLEIPLNISKMVVFPFMLANVLKKYFEFCEHSLVLANIW